MQHDHHPSQQTASTAYSHPALSSKPYGHHRVLSDMSLKPEQIAAAALVAHVEQKSQTQASGAADEVRTNGSHPSAPGPDDSSHKPLKAKAPSTLPVKVQDAEKVPIPSNLIPDSIPEPIAKVKSEDAKAEPPSFSPSPPPYLKLSSSPASQHSMDMERASSHASTCSVAARKLKKPKEVAPIQLIDHLPRAEKDAMATFEELTANDYHDRKLGRAKGKFDDAMVCECSYNPNFDHLSMACSEESDCINRCTQVECLASDCRCAKYCQNQRFQRRQYAPVEIVQTEKKGFGLRAAADLSPETFVYEYVGEVMNQTTFLGRMQQYRDEGIRHFYFMMLQKDEYLDATKKGGKGRFINHSCNPNCFVAKWQVGKYMRMGIFAKRHIAKGEELTFNYNVDRYGNDAQVCYCGEPNCVGTLGGKTQTDIGGMAELFIDALGIAEQVDLTEARGTKKKKSKELDKDFVPVLRPITKDEVTKVMTAMRQAGPNRRILQMLLTRVEMTEDIDVQKLLVKLYGFTLMSFLLDEWRDDNVIVMLTLSGLARWPLIHKNKVVDLGLEEQVKNLRDSHLTPKQEVADVKEDVKPQLANIPADAEISRRADQILNAWDKLDMGYRIARREGDANGDHPEVDSSLSVYIDRRRMQELDDQPVTLDEAQAPNAVSEELGRALPEWRPSEQPPPSRLTRRPPRPNGFASSSRGNSFLSPARPDKMGSRASGSPRTPDQSLSSMPSPYNKPPTSRRPIQDIIRLANEQEEQKRKQAEQAAREAELAGPSSPRKHPHPSSSSASTSEKKRKSDDSDSNEKRLRKMVGDLAVKQMSKHKDALDRETFKKYARELTNLIVSKEMKNPKHWPPPPGPLAELAPEKRTKMKLFCNEYIAKLLARKATM